MEETLVAAEPLKPALASIRDSCKYMGNVSRAKFYSDILPLLETIHIGTRHFVVVASMDSLIASLRGKDDFRSNVQGPNPRRGTPPKARIAARPHAP